MNPFGRGGFFWLLAFEIKLAWRAWWSAGKMGLWARIGLFGLVGVVGLAVGFVLADVLANVAPSPSPAPTGVLIVSALMALVAALMISQALLASTEIVYSRGDLDLLFSSPVSPWTVMMVRACGIAMNVALVYLALVGAVLIWTPLTGASGWLVVAPAVLALALWASAIGLFLARLLLGWLGPRSTRVVAQILAALIGASLFLATQSVNFLPRAEREAYWRDFAQRFINTPVADTDPIWLPARAALGDHAALIGFFGLGLLTFLAAAFWFSRSFVGDAAAAASMGGTRKKRAARHTRLRGGLIGNVVRKEWRLLRRDPLLLSQVGLQIVYLLPMMFVVWGAAARGGGEAALTNSLLGGAFVLLAATLSSSLIWITASAEDAPDLISAAPVARDRVELGKLIAATGPVIVLMTIPAAAIGLQSVAHAGYVMLGAIAAAVSAGLIGIWHQQPANRKEFRKQRSTSWVAGLGQGFVAMCWSGAAGLALAGLEPLSLIPALIAIGLTLALQDSRPKPAT
jgi:ABC-2 type transport system permease protein